MSPMLYRFGDVEIDLAAYTLRRGGREQSLQPKTFDVLRYLLEHRDRVVSKEELLEAVWHGEQVNESMVPWNISQVRNALGQPRGEEAPIKTIYGRGYRFVAAMDVSLPTPTNDHDTRIASSGAVRGKPFVGRQDVMERLQLRLHEAAQGRGRLCLLAGEAGIGKTRCCEELVSIAQQKGIDSWVARSMEEAGAPVFWPFIQLLREAQRSRPELAPRIEPLLAQLAALDPRMDKSPNGEPDTRSRRFWLLDEVTRLLTQAAQQRPVLLVMDDLHCADAGTIDLLEFVAHDLPNARLLVIGTLREQDTRGSGPRIARLSRHAERIELSRLSVDDVGRYIGELTELEAPPISLTRVVHRATAGNPLFVQETLRALLDDHGAEGLATVPATAVKMPEVARDVLRTALDTLDPKARELLLKASVLGERFELPLLQLLSETPLFELLQLLEQPTRRSVIAIETPQRYRFAHGLVRTLLYDEIPTADRVRLHRKAGDALEALQTAEPRFGEIANHLYRSLPEGGYDRVVAAAVRAANAAENALAYEDAVVFYEWALEAQALDPSVGPRARADLLLACGSAQRQAGRDRDARATLTRLFELAHQHGYCALLVRAARVLRPTVAMASVRDSLVREALEAVLRIAPTGANPDRVFAMSQLASVPPHAEDMRRSKQLSEKALQLARELGERGSLFEALRSRLFALSGPDDTDQLLATADELLELDREHSSTRSLEAHSARMGALLYRGEIVAADQALEAVGQTARDFRLPELTWYYDRQRAQQAFTRGELAAAERACEELRGRSRRLGLSYGRMFTEILQQRVQAERTGHCTLEGAEHWSSLKVDEVDLPPNMRARTARTAAVVGRRELAGAVLERLWLHDLEGIPRDVTYLNTLANLAVAVTVLEDRARAEQLYALLAPYERFNTPDALLLDEGSVARYLALLAVLLGRDAQAEQHFEQAIAANRAMRRPAQVAHASVELATFLRDRGQTAARVQELAAQARTIATTSGMSWLAERARALLES